MLGQVADLLLQQETQRHGTWVFLLDQTDCGQSGPHTENTFSRANYRPRTKKGNRKQKKHARRSCHGFVGGLLLTPSGYRVPSCRCYYTQTYCQQQKRPYRTPIELAAELLAEVALPATARVLVWGDTAFEAQRIRAVFAQRGFTWIVPVNPSRVLAGPKPRPPVQSLVSTLSAADFAAVRLVPGQGVLAPYQRVACCRSGPQTKPRTFWAHAEKQAVHHVGSVRLVFSTTEQPLANATVNVQKLRRVLCAALPREERFAA